MPTLAEALKFVRAPSTMEEQLRRACAILFLDAGGPPEVLRDRLLDYLESLEAGDPVVCLNPRLTDAAPQRLRSAVVVMEK